jgi:hypothetical protein
MNFLSSGFVEIQSKLPLENIGRARIQLKLRA